MIDAEATMQEPAWPHWFQVPLNKTEALDRLAEAKARQLEIMEQLTDPTRAKRMNGEEFMAWRAKALHARRIILNQQHWLRRWLTFYNTQQAATRVGVGAARREAHLRRQQQRLLSIDEIGGVPELMRQMVMMFRQVMKQTGTEYTDDITRILNMADAYVVSEDPDL